MCVPENVVETGDLYFAAFLKVAGFRLIRVDADVREGRSGRKVFVFESTSLFSQLKKAYYSRSTDSRVAALSYAHAVRDLKKLVHQKID